MATRTKDGNWVDEVGKPAFDSVAEMVAAVQCDWDRLEELKDERDEYEGNWPDDNADDAEELADLLEAAGDCEDEDEARQRIDDDPLSIELGGWWGLGGEPTADEYRILLTTGGPAVRIVGDLGQHGEPTSARLEVQDWFKPWTEYGCNQDVLLAYAFCFCFEC